MTVTVFVSQVFQLFTNRSLRANQNHFNMAPFMRKKFHASISLSSCPVRHGVSFNAHWPTT